MLYSIDGKEMMGIPRQRRTSFDTWMRELSEDDYDKVVAAINEYVDGVPTNKPFNSSFVPGSDWTDTPYQPLYIACNQNQEHSG